MIESISSKDRNIKDIYIYIYILTIFIIYTYFKFLRYINYIYDITITSPSFDHY